MILWTMTYKIILPNYFPFIKIYKVAIVYKVVMVVLYGF
jgi:hypothetical protein